MEMNKNQPLSSVQYEACEDITYLFVKHETTANRGTLRRGKFIEQSTENHLREHQFIASTNLARNPALGLDNIFRRSEPKTSQNSFPVFELVELQDVLHCRDSLLNILDLLLQRNIFKVSVVKFR